MAYMMPPPWMGPQMGMGMQNPEDQKIKKQIKKLKRQLAGDEEAEYNAQISDALGAIQ
jgi:hypothetical protein